MKEEEPLLQYDASRETLRRRAAQQRKRMITMGPVALAFVIVAIYKSRAPDLWATGILIALIIVGVILRKAYVRQKNLEPGVLWRGSAGIELEDFHASRYLQGYAPSAGASLVLRTNVAFGFLTLGEDYVAWEPDRTTRKVGAREWRLPTSLLTAAESGEIPGLPSLTRLLRKVNEGLTLWFEDGSSVSFLVVWGTGLDRALEQLGLPGRATPKP